MDLSIRYAKNPLLARINGLPRSLTELMDVLDVPVELPIPEERQAEKFYRLIRLADLEKLYVPTSRDIAAGMAVLQMIIRGYEDRMPTATYWRNHEPECLAASEDRKGIPTWPPITRAIFGPSGSGKTSFIDTLFSKIPEVVEHSTESPLSPRKQIVRIKVSCPHKGRPKAFALSALYEIGRVFGQDLSSFSRLSEDALLLILAKQARAHFLGLLIVDETQYAVGRGVNRDRELLRYLVNLTNIIRVPILFVGTPQAQRVLNSQLADARRMCGAPWAPFPKDDPDWLRIVERLWAFQITRSATLLSEQLVNTIHDLTQGIPALAKRLYCFAQERLILNSTANHREELTVELLQEVADFEMASVKPAVRALRTKEGLEAFDDLLPAEMPKPAAWTADLAQLDQAASLSFQESYLSASRRLGRERAAAKATPAV